VKELRLDAHAGLPERFRALPLVNVVSWLKIRQRSRYARDVFASSVARQGLQDLSRTPIAVLAGFDKPCAGNPAIPPPSEHPAKINFPE
jgi:hypothetical protein